MPWQNKPGPGPREKAARNREGRTMMVIFGAKRPPHYRRNIALKKAVAPVVSGIYEITLVTRLSDLVEEIDAAVEDLAAALAAFHKIDDVTESANMVRDVLLPKMEALRKPCDEAEQRTAVGCWPFPTYGDLLFGVQ